jgi:hypothetical protein
VNIHMHILILAHTHTGQAQIVLSHCYIDIELHEFSTTQMCSLPDVIYCAL